VRVIQDGLAVKTTIIWEKPHSAFGTSRNPLAFGFWRAAIINVGLVDANGTFVDHRDLVAPTDFARNSRQRLRVFVCGIGQTLRL
jgi:hypothetical protein